MGNYLMEENKGKLNSKLLDYGDLEHLCPNRNSFAYYNLR